MNSMDAMMLDWPTPIFMYNGKVQTAKHLKDFFGNPEELSYEMVLSLKDYNGEDGYIKEFAKEIRAMEVMMHVMYKWYSDFYKKYKDREELPITKESIKLLPK